MKADEVPAESRRVGRGVQHLDWSDASEAAREATFRRLDALVADDAVPVEEVAVARSNVELRSIDDQLATLVYDSRIDDHLLDGVRSSTRAVRQLTFAARGLVLEIEVADGSRQLVGQVVPPQEALLEMRHRSGCTAVTTDELGCFHLPAVPEGPVSFRCRPSRLAADSIATSWITL
jgi:hypothetical protein